MNTQSETFDRALSLRELLSGVAPEKLAAALAALLDAPARIVSADGGWVLGDAAPLAGNIERLALSHELETVGFLESASAHAEHMRAAAAMLELLMQSGARYFMASQMHLEVVNSDYEELQRRHQALAASEARYKALAENLEARVREQVSSIETAHRQLYQAEKMASVGQLAAGVAHEINNPMGFIRSNLNTAQSYVRKFGAVAGPIQSGDAAAVARAWRDADMDFMLEDFSALLKESMEGADRVAHIVADLKAFSSVDHAEEEAADLNDSIRSACNVAANTVNSRAELKLDLGTLPPLRCKAGAFNQVFLNLLLNAAQAMARRGEIRIKSRAEDGDIVIAFSDTGCGIPPEVLPRIFDPFFSTRDVGSGTGLGLTVSRDIIRAHGGSIEASSTPGAGTTFTIRLPVKREESY